jgi:hypothetical protein
MIKYNIVVCGYGKMLVNVAAYVILSNIRIIRMLDRLADHYE